MVVNFRGKDINAAGVRVSGTKITATPNEINQALDGISADVTAANLSALTGGAETDLHSHAASGGGSLPIIVWESLLLTQSATLTVTTPLPVSGAQFSSGAWTNNGDGDLVMPVTGWYEVMAQGSFSTGGGAAGQMSWQVNSDTSDILCDLTQVNVPEASTLNGLVSVGRVHATAGQSIGTLYASATAQGPVAAVVSVRIACLVAG
jgi:hypothetical protein